MGCPGLEMGWKLNVLGWVGLEMGWKWAGQELGLAGNGLY